ncbi:MAG: type 1 glutamine amidotransferase [Pirellulales bacterium]
MTQRPVLIWRHVDDEPPGVVVDVLCAAGVATEIWDLSVPGERTFDVEAYLGIVILGGPMSVDQTTEYPFLAAEIRWLRDALKHKLPILGLCLGGQLLAKALGAKVCAHPVPELGWHTVELTPAGEMDPLLSETPSPAPVCQWHGDTFDLPAGGVLLASSAICRHQAFRFGSTAWGFQFHPEVSRDLLERWMADHGDPGDRCCPGAAGEARIRDEIDRWLPQAQIVGKRILGRFAKLCKESNR